MDTTLCTIADVLQPAANLVLKLQDIKDDTEITMGIKFTTAALQIFSGGSVYKVARVFFYCYLKSNRIQFSCDDLLLRTYQQLYLRQSIASSSFTKRFSSAELLLLLSYLLIGIFCFSLFDHKTYKYKILNYELIYQKSTSTSDLKRSVKGRQCEISRTTSGRRGMQHRSCMLEDMQCSLIFLIFYYYILINLFIHFFT